MKSLIDDGRIYLFPPLQSGVQVFTGRGPGGAGGYPARGGGVYPGLSRLQCSLVSSLNLELPQMIRMGVFKDWRRSLIAKVQF